MVVMAAKRPAGDTGGAPPPKKVALGPIDIGPSSGEEDLNIKILQVTYTALVGVSNCASDRFQAAIASQL